MSSSPAKNPSTGSGTFPSLSSLSLSKRTPRSPWPSHPTPDSALFPILPAASDDTKQRVRPRTFDAAQLPISFRVARHELRQQMFPFVIELPAGHVQVAGITGAADFGRVEAIPADERLCVKVAQIRSRWRRPMPDTGGISVIGDGRGSRWYGLGGRPAPAALRATRRPSRAYRDTSDASSTGAWRRIGLRRGSVPKELVAFRKRKESAVRVELGQRTA